MAFGISVFPHVNQALLSQLDCLVALQRFRFFVNPAIRSRGSAFRFLSVQREAVFAAFALILPVGRVFCWI